ncbi:MAG: bifunctional oligoribonuclease/PAP phosphatase NrnA [Planctomycetaceae bacterium]
MAVDWKPLGEIISKNERFVLTSHVRPDADALGSELAMANMLESQGKQVVIANASAAPPNLGFLDPDGRVKRLGDSVTAEEVLDTDVHMVLDTSAWAQLANMGDVLRKTSAQKVVIDHHVSSDDLGAIEFKDTTAEATGTLMHQIGIALDLPISKETAEFIFCAMATDTGWFRFPSINSDTMRIVADLMDRGVEPHVLYGKLYEQSSVERLHLRGRVLSRVRVACDGLLGFTTVELKDFKASGASPVDTEGLVNQCMTITGTQAAFTAVEQQNGRVKISFRSRPGVDVSQLAEQFGGGGHKQASGATLPGPIRVAVSKVLSGYEQLLGCKTEAAEETA